MVFPQVLNNEPIYEMIDQVTKFLAGLAASIDNVTRNIVRLEMTLSQLTIQPTVERISQIAKVDEAVIPVSNTKEKGFIAMQSGTRSEPAPTSTTMDAAGTFFKNTGELVGKLDGLPKQAAQLKDLFGIAGNISAGMDGISELFTKEHLTLADGLSIAGKVASGIMGVVEATARGPEAGVISAAAMVRGSIISYVTNQQEKEEAYTVAKQQQYKKAMGTFCNR